MHCTSCTGDSCTWWELPVSYNAPPWCSRHGGMGQCTRYTVPLCRDKPWTMLNDPLAAAFWPERRQHGPCHWIRFAWFSSFPQTGVAVVLGPLPTHHCTPALEQSQACIACCFTSLLPWSGLAHETNHDIFTALSSRSLCAVCVCHPCRLRDTISARSA